MHRVICSPTNVRLVCMQQGAACCSPRLPSVQVLEPLKLACTLDAPRIVEPALGCIHKLVRHSLKQWLRQHLSMHLMSMQPRTACR